MKSDEFQVAAVCWKHCPGDHVVGAHRHEQYECWHQWLSPSLAVGGGKLVDGWFGLCLLGKCAGGVTEQCTAYFASELRPGAAAAVGECRSGTTSYCNYNSSFCSVICWHMLGTQCKRSQCDRVARHLRWPALFCTMGKSLDCPVDPFCALQSTWCLPPLW